MQVKPLYLIRKYSTDEIVIKLRIPLKANDFQKSNVPAPDQTTHKKILQDIKQFSKSYKTYASKSKKEKCKISLNYLSKRLTGDEVSSVLPSQFVVNSPICPYDREAESEYANGTNKQPIKFDWLKNTKRLNISSLMLNRDYCELQRMYNVYSGTGRPDNIFMKIGTQVHKKFEDLTHKPVGIMMKSKDNIKTQEIYVDLDSSLVGAAIDDVQDILSKHTTKNIINTALPDIGNNNSTEKELSPSKVMDIEGVINIVAEPKSIENVQVHVNNESKINQSAAYAFDSGLNILPKDSFLEVKQTEGKLSVDDSFFQVETIETGNDFIVDLAQTFNRLQELFYKGECREIKICGFYDRYSHQLVESIDQLHDDPNRYIYLSGIIDHVQMEDMSFAFDDYQMTLRQAMNNTKCIDFESWMKHTHSVYSEWNEMLPLVVRDLKTRHSRKSISLNTSSTAFCQVGTYRKCLGILSSNAKLSFHLLELACIKRQIDIWEPIDSDKVKLIASSSLTLAMDFLKLKNGETLNYGVLNETVKSKASRFVHPLSSNKYTPSNIISNYTIPEFKTNIPLLSELEGEWQMVPTTAHIIARLAQVMSLCDNSFSDHHWVDYKRSDNIQSMNFKYDDNEMSKIIDISMDLWLGRREPMSTDITSVCQNCVFGDKCEAGLRLLGKLQDVKNKLI
ncbi:Exo5 protein [Martiniozyma asiatica (nom. inval.)]|nr:Exo5 protein [Martiniozyma asiatica]